MLSHRLVSRAANDCIRSFESTLNTEKSGSSFWRIWCSIFLVGMDINLFQNRLLYLLKMVFFLS
jgi:hypothetical protein